ncbi:hypothetical protein [Luteimonas sp. e5]
MSDEVLPLHCMPAFLSSLMHVPGFADRWPADRNEGAPGYRDRARIDPESMEPRSAETLHFCTPKRFVGPAIAKTADMLTDFMVFNDMAPPRLRQRIRQHATMAA